MITLIVLVGVRGSGKSSVLGACEERTDVCILKPSTTRTPRTREDEEYHFEPADGWGAHAMEWEISLGNERYGMRKEEISRIQGSKLGITVFDPSSISILKQYAERSSLEIVSVGLDTVREVEEQSRRTEGNPSRAITDAELQSQIKIVQSCDVALRGDLDTVCAAVHAVIDILGSRGGLVPRKQLESLLLGGTLLRGGNINSLSTASYDLCLGDDVWCQGRFTNLSEGNPTLSIPPYSYAIVSAGEMADLPNFLSGRFDLKVSLFFRGTVLSNGPQVDPGYKGALFCMLYNGNDQPVGITRGQHFATIEFITTATVSAGYKDQYQSKFRLSDFIPADAAVAKGGQILERMLEIEKSMRTEWNALRFGAFTILAVALSVLVLVSITIWNTRADALRIIDRLEKTERPVVEESVQQATNPDYERTWGAVHVQQDKGSDEKERESSAEDSSRQN